MSHPATPRQIFERQMRAFGALDLEALIEVFSDDCVLQDMADPEHPHVGVQAIRAFLEDYFATIEDVELRILTTAVVEDKVVGELELHATWVGEPLGPDAARRVVMRYVAIDTVRDGRVVFERFYWDRAELDRQLATPGG